MKIRIVLLIGVVLFVGCGRNAFVDSELVRAKGYMRTQPDSALNIIERINPADITRRHTRAQYGLLYSQALDKNYIDVDNDSLIRFASDYYDHHICSDSVKFLVNYHYGRVYHNAKDYKTAIPYYLTAEKHAFIAKKNYFLGLVYTRIGEIYYEQMNYKGMLEYYLNAYEYFKKLRNPSFHNNALFYIANAYSCLGDNDNAHTYYTMAFEMAERSGNNEIMAACLSSLGAIYAAEEDSPKALQMVREMIEITPDALSIFEYKLLAKAYSEQHKIDSARYYLNASRELAEDIRDEASLAYLSYQIETQARNYDMAQGHINEYIALSDSISRMVLNQSAMAAEGKYYKEQSAFEAYRLKVRGYFEVVIGLLTCIVVGILIYSYRQRMVQKRKEIERYMVIIDDIHASRERIVAQLEQKGEAESRLKELALSRFDILDQLGRTFYERDNTKAQQEAIFRQVKSFITNLSSDLATKCELERIVNTVNDNIIVKLREQFPKFKPADIDLLCYVYAGFSAQIISLLVEDTVHNVYARKSRLKVRICTSNAPDKSFFVDKMP